MIKKSIPELSRISIEEYRGAAKLPLCLIIDNVRSRHNVGAMFRTADAFRADSLHLCGITPVPPDADIHKTALGAENAVAWKKYPSTVDAIRELKADGWTVCALEQAHGSVPLQTYIPARGQKTAIIAGNEVEGVSEEALAMCDFILEIPQQGTKHSLNVSVSASIALYHFFITIVR